MSHVTASSTSTYMDLTRASTASQAPTSVAPTDADGEVIAQAAKVLAAIHAGAHVVPELKEKTSLETDEIVAILAGLSKAGLVVLQDENGTLRVTLTEATEVALSS